MNRKLISHRINDIRDSLERLENNLRAMDSLDIQRYPENYEVMSTGAALEAEKITCRLRNLLFATTSIPKEEYLVQAAETHGTQINVSDGIVEITLPRLLPGKKSHQSCYFLLDPLHAALTRYTRENPFPRFSQCVVCISHVYDHELADWRIVDYDNIQQKQLLDTVATFLMEDDCGLLCDAYNTTELGRESCTRIYIMGKERFTGWLAERQDSLKTISDF